MFLLLPSMTENVYRRFLGEICNIVRNYGNEPADGPSRFRAAINATYVHLYTLVLQRDKLTWQYRAIAEDSQAFRKERNYNL